MAKIKLTQEIVDKALHMRCDSEKGKLRLKKLLLKLPFVKNNDTSTDTLEKVLIRYETKYDVHMSYISRFKEQRENGSFRHYSGMIKNSKGEWLETTYGVDIWEVYAKALIFLYYYVQEGCKGGRKTSGT